MTYTPLSFLFFLFLLSLSYSGGSDADDWTKCSPGCSCSWVNGKRTANCESQEFTSLPIFHFPDKIQVLVLNHNYLHSLKKKAFESVGLINLQKVYLQNCSIAYLDPTAFSGLVIMIELDLSWNRITSLVAGTFTGNIRIRKLRLNHNPLRNLDSYVFPPIPHLRILDISHCKLTQLNSQTFYSLSSAVEVIHLNDNNFRFINRSVFSTLQGRLKSLTLERNPWHCDCRLQEFWTWLMANNLFSLPTSCFEPKKLKGITWNELKIDSLACSPRVKVFNPMITVSSGQTAVLPCLVDKNPNAKIYWVRSGKIIMNNSLGPLNEGRMGERQFYTLQMGPATTRLKLISIHLEPSNKERAINTWLNLTIRNVQHSGAGEYTCVAKNEGGSDEGNVTLVYSESVMSYLDHPEISILLVTGIATGLVMFFLVGGIVFVVLMERRKRRQNSLILLRGRQSITSYSVGIDKRRASGTKEVQSEKTRSIIGQVNKSLLEEEEEEDVEIMERIELKELNKDSKLYHQRPPEEDELIISKPSSATSSSSQYQDDSGCGDSQTTCSGMSYVQPPPDILDNAFYPSRPPVHKKQRDNNDAEKQRLFYKGEASSNGGVGDKRNTAHSLCSINNNKGPIILHLYGHETSQRGDQNYNSRSNLLFHEYESRRDLLEALVKDKNDTIV
uniref:Ig-like domain-containing protein n=1 Tax=Lepeophtheirus salmonis TaxID=72036 RepID=A0A0K2V2N0_LEPSM